MKDDKKSGYEKAAEATPGPVPVPVDPKPTSGSPAKQNEPIVVTTKKKARTASTEIKAMNRIEAILEELDPNTAERVARYAYEKARQRDHDRIKADMANGNSLFAESPIHPMVNRALGNG